MDVGWRPMTATRVDVERESRAHGDGLTGMSGVATGEAEITHGGGEEVEGVQHDMAPQREVLLGRDMIGRSTSRTCSVGTWSVAPPRGLARYITEPLLEMLSFDHRPCPYAGLGGVEIFEKRKTVLDPSLFHYYQESAVTNLYEALDNRDGILSRQLLRSIGMEDPKVKTVLKNQEAISLMKSIKDPQAAAK
uniref:Uncharacterized protein n=1 Tax=Zea mays TaxID=4577 RepID=Q9XEJ1_MAIZE|nr:hypothetical protein [Zea mays]